MKPCAIATILTILALRVGAVSAQTIGIFSDSTGADCNLTVPFASAAIAHVLYVPGGGILDIIGAEFQIEGLETSGWMFNSTVNPLAAATSVGDPFLGGASVAFPSCQAGFQVVSLYTILLINLNPTDSPIAPPRLMSVTGKFVTHLFGCAFLLLCDAPVFTKVCVSGGEAWTNNPGVSCTVAVEETSWSAVKSLYN